MPYMDALLSYRPQRRRRAVALAAHTGPAADDAIVREPECARLTGLSRSTRWRMERAGHFPRRRRISPSCIGWLRSEILAWMASRCERPTLPRRWAPPAALDSAEHQRLQQACPGLAEAAHCSQRN